jgi:prepilin signal peptidase PulO-like enzyme (type II secretory pathway)
MKFDVVKASFWLTFALSLTGALLKLQKLEFSGVFMTLGILALITLIVSCLLEINESKTIDGTEKFMWTIGFVFFWFITAIVYFISGRKRILKQTSIKN